MAFPVGWAGYDTPSSLAAPSASLSDFTYLVSLDQMSATWWSNVKSDGGDIRATKSDGTTELACDLIEWDYASQSGLLAVKYSGTQSTSPDDILIWCGNASATLPAVSDTYGQYNAYASAVKAFYPQGGGNDRTVNAKNLTLTNATAGDATGPINGSKATTYNGTSAKAASSTGAVTGDGMFLASSYDTKGAGTSVIFCRSTSSGGLSDGIFNISSSSELYGVYRDGGGPPVSTTTGVSVPLNAWGASSAGFDNGTGQIFVYDYTGGSGQTSSTDGAGAGIVIAAAGTTNYWGGRVSLALYTTNVSARAAYSAYWFAMVNAADPDQSDFYGTWSWTAAGGGGTDNLTATGIATGAPSVGTPTVGQVHALTATGVATGSPAVGSPALGQEHALTATGVATGSPTVGTPTLGQSHDLTATGIDTGSPTTGTPTLGIDGELTAVGIATGAPTVGSPTLGQEHALTATGIATGAPTVGTPSMSGSVELTATGITTGAPTVGTPALGQLHALATAGIASGAPSVGSPLLFQVHVLTATAISLGAPAVGSPAVNGADIIIYPRAIPVTGDGRSTRLTGNKRSVLIIGGT